MYYLTFSPADFGFSKTTAGALTFAFHGTFDI